MAAKEFLKSSYFMGVSEVSSFSSLTLTSSLKKHKKLDILFYQIKILAEIIYRKCKFNLNA